MDRDYDIEMEDVEAFPIQGAEVDDILPVDDAQEPGEVDETPAPIDLDAEANRTVPTKVHLRGLDTLNPDDIKTYFSEVSGGGRFQRIEWVDDTSANLLFNTESTASEALVCLSAIELADTSQLPPLELLPAKPFSKKPDVTLLVRFAVEGDRKAEGAAARSRFYLLNPQYDPEERRRRGEFGRRGRYHDHDRSDSRRERDYDRDYDRRHSRRNGRGRLDDRYADDQVETFDASLYDDDDAALAKRASAMTRRRRTNSRSRSRSRSRLRSRRLQSRSLSRSRSRSHSRSGSSGIDRRERRDNSSKELFPDFGSRRNRNGGSGLRDRSASPARSRDGDVRMSRERERERKAEEKASSARNRDKARAIKDRLSAPQGNGAKELFPGKLSSGAGGAGGNAQMDLFVDNVDVVSKRLSDRIRRSDEPAAPASATEGHGSGSTFSIRGIAQQQGGANATSAGIGLSIKGRATARELFPEKLGNAGKELFADKLEGRGRPRKRAEDSFH